MGEDFKDYTFSWKSNDEVEALQSVHDKLLLSALFSVW